MQIFPNLIANDYKSHVVVNGMVTFWLIFTSVTTTKIFYGVCSDGGPNGAPPSPPNFIRILLDLEVSEAHKVQDPRLDPNHNLGLYNFF